MPEIVAPARPSVLILSATRQDETTFLRESLLARSLALHADTAKLRARVAFDNRESLASVFNRGIASAKPEEIVVFCHDDTSLEDSWLPDRLEEALGHFDLIGIAGCIHPLPEHSSWTSGHVHTDANGRPRIDGRGNLAGRVRHDHGPTTHLTVYGAAPQAVQLLDGCFLAVRAETLLRTGLRFDARFDFHFYDLDFCRTARALGLTAGVWPLAIAHGSSGDFSSPSWQMNLARYWQKWPPPASDTPNESNTIQPNTAQPHSTQSKPIGLGPITAETAGLFNTANADYRAAQWQNALAGYDQVLAQAPTLAAAWLGRARCLTRQGEWQAAGEAYARALTHAPDDYSSWLESAHLHRQTGELEPAITTYQRAIQLHPYRHEAWLGLTRTLEQAGHARDASNAFTETLRAAAQTSPATLRTVWHLLGRYRLERGELPGALTALRTALGLVLAATNTENLVDEAAEIRIDIAELLLRDHQHERAHKFLTEASTARAEATLTRLSETAFRYNLWKEAIEVSRQNLALHPESALAHWNLAHLLAECWQMSEASQLLDKACTLAPMPSARTMRAQMAGRTGDVDAALAHYRAYHAENPADRSVASSIAMSALYSDRLATEEVARLTQELFLPLGEAARTPQSFHRAPLIGKDGRQRRIRLGLVSADLHFQHPVNIFMQPILRELDRSRFEVFLYFTGISSDSQTQLARSRVDHWIEATHFNNRQLALQIDADGIDLLMDLSGHTGHNRMALFAQRAAPVQISYLGYPGSTGLPNMDWIIGDSTVTPPQHDALYSERVARLPGTVFCYAPEAEYPFPHYTQSHAERPLTFGSFNNVPKLTPHTLHLWTRILTALPEARLVLKAPSFGDASACAFFHERLAALGIPPDRVELRGPVGLTDMMAEYADIDIALDPIPYNGGTTTLQALWMGVPVVVQSGGHFVSRMGASFMKAAGLEDWIANDDDAYVAIAIAKARDRQALLTLKQGLRDRQLASPAWDVVRHTRALEAVWLHCVGSSVSAAPAVDFA